MTEPAGKLNIKLSTSIRGRRQNFSYQPEIVADRHTDEVGYAAVAAASVDDLVCLASMLTKLAASFAYPRTVSHSPRMPYYMVRHGQNKTSVAETE